MEPVRVLYGQVLLEVFGTDRTTKERDLCLSHKPMAIFSRTD